MDTTVKTPKCSVVSQAESEVPEQIARTLNCIDKECRWVQQARAIKTLDDIERALFECMCRLNNVKKLPKALKLPIVAPELRTINLVSLVNPDVFSAKVTLMAENLQHAEISFKHIRANNGVYKAHLKSQYKIQQLQDCTNKIARTLRILNEGRDKFLKASSGDQYNQQTGKCLAAVLTEIRNQIKCCLKSLSPPDVRNYWELYNSSVMGYLEPAPPSDVLLSFYISTDRLICTAYQVTPKQGNSHFLTSYHVESRVDTLASLFEALSNAQWNATALLISLDMFQAYQSKTGE
ncbi:Rogdi-like family protein [Aphelenchoides bicaudatus]|nr:Rogdi-like family protein [Aphelenchoides bicaudatus]